MRVLPVVNVNLNQESIRVTRRNEGVLPPQSVPVSVCEGVEAYKEFTPSASDSLGNTIPPGDIEDPGNARADFPNASEERNLRYISRHSRVLFEPFPGTQGIWRVASSYRLKTPEPTHRRSSLLHAHHKLSAEYRLKRRLSVQNRSAGCVLSVTNYNISTKQELPFFCLRKQGIPVLNTSLQSEHCPSCTYLPGTYSGSLPPSSRDISNSIL